MDKKLFLNDTLNPVRKEHGGREIPMTPSYNGINESKLTEENLESIASKFKQTINNISFEDLVNLYVQAPSDEYRTFALQQIKKMINNREMTKDEIFSLIAMSLSKSMEFSENNSKRL